MCEFRVRNLTKSAWYFGQPVSSVRANVTVELNRWIEQGERSSKYFCNLEKRSNEKKSIHILKNDSGTIISDQHAHYQ